MEVFCAQAKQNLSNEIGLEYERLVTWREKKPYDVSIIALNHLHSRRDYHLHFWTYELLRRVLGLHNLPLDHSLDLVVGILKMALSYDRSKGQSLICGPCDLGSSVDVYLVYVQFKQRIIDVEAPTISSLPFRLQEIVIHFRSEPHRHGLSPKFAFSCDTSG